MKNGESVERDGSPKTPKWIGLSFARTYEAKVTKNDETLKGTEDGKKSKRRMAAEGKRGLNPKRLEAAKGAK